MLNEPARLRIPIGAPLPGEGPLEIAIDVFAPAHVAEPAVLLFCMPGGGMNRRYFDLQAEGASFAEAMTARGFIVVALDHLGIERAALLLPDRGLSKIPELAAKRFGGLAYAPIPNSTGGSAASKALEAAADDVPTVPASHSMMPGNIREEIARIDVPVLLAAGDRDMVGPPRELPVQFAAANDITLIIIEKCGHHPFASANTPRFLARAADWVRAQAQ